MEEKKEKALLKKEKAYKRSRRVSAFFAGLFSIVVLGGVILGFYASEKEKLDFKNYKDTDEYRIVHYEDLNKINREYYNKQISKEEYDEKIEYISGSNQTYLKESMERTGSELKDEIQKDENLIVGGIATSVLGIAGVIGSGIIAAKKDEKYQQEIEKEKNS